MLIDHATELRVLKATSRPDSLEVRSWNMLAQLRTRHLLEYEQLHRLLAHAEGPRNAGASTVTRVLVRLSLVVGLLEAWDGQEPRSKGGSDVGTALGRAQLLLALMSGNRG
jgi:hypothetical protein